LPSALLDLLAGHVANPIPSAVHAGRAKIVGRGFPLRNAHFVGREDLLHRLEIDLDWGSSVAVQALHGLGGVGKTQLAAEFAHRHLDDYDLVAWINSETPTLIPEQLAGLAPALGVPVSGDIPGTADAVLDALTRTALAWLIIFDNAEDPKALEQFLPRAGLGHVIVTSRQSDWNRLGATLDVDVLSRDEAVTLLRERVPGIDEGIASQIVTQLGDLPLAVEQAGSYLARTGKPAGEYLTALRDRAEELLDRGYAGGYEHTLATVWHVSAENLKASSPAAAQLLQLCAFLAPEPIPLDLFTAHSDLLPAALAEPARDELRFDDTVGELVHRSLARRSSDGITIHRLLAAAIRRPLNDDDRNVAITTVWDLLAHHLPREILSSPENWPVWQAVLPHVLAAAAHPSPAASTSRYASGLLDRAGTFLQTTGQPAAALPLFERALRLAEETYGSDHAAVAARLVNLAELLKDLGQPIAAKPLFERAVRIDEAIYGPDHHEVATDLGMLAGVLRDLGQAADARPLLERGLRIDEATYGPDHPTVAMDMADLAGVLQDLGQPAEARPLLEDALRVFEARYGPDHPQVSTLLSNLGTVLQELGQPVEAKPLLERALRIDESTYGPDHPDVASRLNNLAYVLTDLGQADAARPLLERAIRILESTYGPDHPRLAIMLNNLAYVLKDLGQAAAGRPLLERALRIDEGTYGPDHPATKSIRASLGDWPQ
jgi:tetratricopeptide (TPR) repeat protein